MKQILVQIAREQWKPLTASFVVGISQTMVGLFSIVFFQRLLDELVAVQALDPLLPTLLIYGGLTGLNHLLIYLSGYPRSLLENASYLWVKLRAMRKIAGIDFLAYQNLGTGNLIQLVENGATATQQIFNNFYVQIFRDMIPSAIVAFLLIRSYDQTLFLVLLGVFGLLFLLSFYLMAFLQRETDRMLAEQENFARFSTRGFMEMVVFRVNGRFAHEVQRISTIADDIVRARAKLYLVQELFFTGFAALVFLIEMGVIVQQGLKIIDGTSTIGTLVALVTFVKTAQWPISQFSIAWVQYKVDVVAFRRLQTFLALPDDQGLAQTEPLAIGKGDIDFENVTFAYPDQPILANFSLHCAGGQTTALVGTSGSGKTTLVRLLLQLVKPDKGEVLVDKRPLSTIDLNSFYQQVAYIPQEPPIFDGTIRENLLFDAEMASEKLDDILQQVGLSGLIGRLTNGLDTLVGERGIKLSGGERQRLAFGRLLVQDPKLVIMDEPTASLDSLTESFISDNLTRFLQGRTVIIIAHRLQTVQAADKIVVLETGKITQQGIFPDLVGQSGTFQELWQMQASKDIGS